MASRLKRLGRFALLACLAGLPALALASPPDPVWLPGIWDGGDHDDEVAMLTDTAVAHDSDRVAAGPPPLDPRSTRMGSASAPADRSLLGSHLRSPPIS